MFVASLNDIVDLTIQADSRTVSRQGFGTPLILTYHTRFADNYVAFGSLAEMAAAPYSFVDSDDAYRMAAACFSQDPAVEQVLVGRLATAPSFVTSLTMTAGTAGLVAKCKVIAPEAGTLTDPALAGGVISPTGAIAAGDVISITYTLQAGDTTATLAAASIEPFIECIPGVNSVAALGVIAVTPATAGRKVHCYDLTYFTIDETTAAAGAYTTAIAAVAGETSDFYAILADTCSDANVAAIGLWVEQNAATPKMYFVGTSNSKDLTSGGVAAAGLYARGNDRVVMIYTKNSHEFAGAAWAGVGLPQDPGSINWAFKELVGVIASSLTTAQEGFLEGDYENHYQTLNGLSRTRPGTVTSGEWIDIIHGTDALRARIKEDVYAVLASNPKVAYTDAGLVLIHSALLAALRAFEGNDNDPGLLARGSSTVIVPLVSSISSAVKATRVLPGIRFSATYEGAVNSVGITGVVSF